MLPGGRARLRPSFPRLRRQRRDPAIGWIDNQRSAPRRDHLDPTLPPDFRIGDVALAIVRILRALLNDSIFIRGGFLRSKELLTGKTPGPFERRKTGVGPQPLKIGATLRGPGHLSRSGDTRQREGHHYGR